MFRIIEEKYISKLPGWCHNSVKERPDGFARKLSSLLEKKELLTLEEFVARFRDDILPGYHGAPDPPDDAAVLDGMPGWMVAIESMSPLQRYLSLEKAKTPVPDWKTLGILKRHYYPDKDVINHYGVRFQNVCYTDEALSGHVGERVDILCHTFTKPYAPGSITVLLNGKFLCEAFPVQKHKMVGEAPEALQDSDDIQDLAKKEMSQAVQRISRSAHSILPGNMDEQEPSKKDQMREMAYAQMPQEAGNSPSRGGPAVTTPSNGLPETTVSPANLNDAYDALFGAS